MGGVTKEQVALAKSVDILSYLQTHEPGNLKKSGGNEYRLIDHDSLKISNGYWHWFSRGIGGKTALDYLIHVRELPFVEAVRLLTDGKGADVSFQPVKTFVPKKREDKALHLPLRNQDCGYVRAYLTGRGIDSEVIDLCIRQNLLCESANTHHAVFIGKDGKGTPRYACMRGTQGDFKQEATGSNKQFGFCLPPQDPESHLLAVSESAVDALSVATIRKMDTGAWRGYHYLSLGGTSPLALTQYLQDHPHIRHVVLCLDNDKAGHEGMARIERLVLSDSTLKKRITLKLEPPPTGKDYNETLQSLIKQNREQNKSGRPDYREAVSR